jgi:hypothetical protein
MRVFFARKFLTGVMLLAIVALGFGLRAVNFDEWLYFKLDQARDAMLISDAVEKGPAYLPLLGQRVGAIDLEKGLLRVGPASYSFQYLSGAMFDSTHPAVFSYPDLLFGTLAIVMLFLLARLALSVPTSLLVSALLSVSFIGVQYSRFAWNPNPLPFFLLLSLYGMLRCVNESNAKKKYFFLALWILGFGIGAQLHFFGMMSLLGITGFFLLWRFGLWKREAIRKVFSRKVYVPILKYAGVAMAILLFLSAPIIANDILRNGENTRNFFEAMMKKQDAKPISESLEKAWSENTRYWCLLTTAECVTDSEKKNRLPIAATLALLAIGFCVAILRLRALPEGKEKDFFRLLFVWAGVFFVLSIPVAFQLRPRFFLVVLPIPFLLWGVLFEYAREKWKRAGMLAGLAVFVALFGLNVRGIYLWFHEQGASQKGDVPVSRTLILKNKDGVTLGQLERAADLIFGKLKKGDRLYFYVKPEHTAPMTYLFEQKQKSDPNFVFESMKVNADPQARFFAIVPEEQTEVQAVIDKFDISFSILSFESVGQIAVAEISFANRSIDSNFTFDKKSTGNKPAPWLDKHRTTDRLFWGDVFFGGAGNAPPEQEEESASEDEE